MLCTVVVNIVLSIILGIQIGAPGVIIASVIARLTTYFWYEPALIYKLYFHKKPIGYYFDFLVSCFLIIISYYIISTISNYLGLNEPAVIDWIINAFLSIFVISALYLARYCWTIEFKDFSKRLVRMLKG